MTLDGNLIPVVKTGASHGAVIQTKAGHANNMQISSGSGTKSSNIACILRDFGFNQGNMKDRLSVIDCQHSSLNLRVLVPEKRAHKIIGTAVC
jgi:hypothetical protein